MNDKERVYAVMTGNAIDRMPVYASYSHLYHMDHFDELTGQPPYHYQKWVNSPMEEFLKTFEQILEAAPFDIVQPPGLNPEAERKNISFVEKDGRPFLYYKKEDHLKPIVTESKSGHNTGDYYANQQQLVFDKQDIDEQVKVIPEAQYIAEGYITGLSEIVRHFGDNRFIMAGGAVGTVWSCGDWFGQQNLLMYLIEKPDLVEYLCKKITEKSIELIRAKAQSGVDAFFIDDATATSDMISPEMYERFSLPYMKQMVQEIKSLGCKSVIVYFGGISDRLEQIASIGADALNMEASMKGFTNDLGDIAEKIGDRITLCSNLNPYEHLELLRDAELESVMDLQAEAGKKARGLITTCASPITMKTPLTRVKKFIEYGRTLPVGRPL